MRTTSIQTMRKRSTSGSAAIEFALIGPAFFMMLFAIIEIGMVFFANMTLENAVKTAGRLIRTGQVQNADMTPEEFRSEVCSHVSTLLSCDGDKLLIDVRAFSSFGGSAFPPPFDANGDLNPNLNSFDPGSSGRGGNSIVLMRVFYKWQLFTPFFSEYFSNMGAGSDVRLLSSSLAFKNEPF